LFFGMPGIEILLHFFMPGVQITHRSHLVLSFRNRDTIPLTDLLKRPDLDCRASLALALTSLVGFSYLAGIIPFIKPF